MKRLFLALAAVISIFIFSTAALAQVTDGLIGYWKFDGNGNNEVSGGTGAATVGNAQFKSSGGQSGGYLYVNTSSDWGKIPYNATFDLVNSLTVEFWFRQRSDQTFYQDFVYKGTYPSPYNFRVYRYVENDKRVIIGGSTAVGAEYSFSTSTSDPSDPAFGVWHHLVYTRNLSGQTVYLDGKAGVFRNFTEYSYDGGSVKTPAVDIIIGDSAVDTDFDNLRIYNRALSYLEVTQNGGFPAPTTTTTYPLCSSVTPNYCYTQNACTGVGAGNWCEGSGGGFYCSSTPCPANQTNQTNVTTTSPPGGPSAGGAGAGGGSGSNVKQTTTTWSVPTTTQSTNMTQNTCPIPNGMGYYLNGLCVVNYCNSGYYNCDSNGANGCESASPCPTSNASGGKGKSSCSDSDGGISVYSRGFSTDKNGQVSEDKCSENNLTEFYCKDGEVASLGTACANGCNDGACISGFAKLIQDLIALLKSIFGLK